MPNTKAVVYICSTKRNTFYSLIDMYDRKVKVSLSAGDIKPSKKNSYLNVKLLAQVFVQRVLELKYRNLSFVLRGLGFGRGAALNAFKNSGLCIDSVTDTTLTPHNGCRPVKIRRKKLRTRMSFRVRRLLSPGL